MDRLAACHLMHGFIHVPNNRGRHATSPNCQNIKANHRSLSLVDRRGFISPAKSERRGIISPFCHRTIVNENDEYKESRHSMKKIHDINLIMQVMDCYRFTSNDLIGEIVLPIKGVHINKAPNYQKNLQQPTVSKEQFGELMITMCYAKNLNKLTVNILKARDLPNRDKLKSSDPYVKLWLVQKGQKLEKRKTSVRPQTLMPIFNESFSFTNLPPREILMFEINLVITVMDFDLLSSNDEIGHVIIGTLGNESGIRQWQDSLNHSETLFSTWHRLTPKW